MDVFFGVIHTRTLLENLLSVIVTVIRQFKRLINVLGYTSLSLTFAMNATDHINVVFHKFAYSSMSRVTASPNSIVTAIVNSDAYHQSPLMDDEESRFMCRNNHRYNYLSICQCVMNDFVINKYRYHMTIVP